MEIVVTAEIRDLQNKGTDKINEINISSWKRSGRLKIVFTLSKYVCMKETGRKTEENNYQYQEKEHIISASTDIKRIRKQYRKQFFTDKFGSIP